MEVHELAPGEQAPEGSDRITINVLANGKVGFAGIRLMGNVNHHSVSPNSFDTEDEALAVALTWAEENSVKVVYVERPNA
jgi:hypothetical protein